MFFIFCEKILAIISNYLRRNTNMRRYILTFVNILFNNLVIKHHAFIVIRSF